MLPSWKCLEPVPDREALEKRPGEVGDMIWVEDEQRMYGWVAGHGWAPEANTEMGNDRMKVSCVSWISRPDPAGDKSWDQGPFDD